MCCYCCWNVLRDGLWYIFCDCVVSRIVIVVVMDFEFMIFFVLVDYIVEDVCSFDGLSLDDGFVWDFGS